MKKLLMLGLLFSFSVSATEICFVVDTDYPVAVDLVIKNRLNRSRTESFEIVPSQFLCKSYSNLKTKSINFEGRDIDECSGTIKGSGKFLLKITDDGCSLINS